MLQIVHDVAPGPTWIRHRRLGTGQLRQQHREAGTSAGAKVIVDDLVYVEEPFFQDSVIAQAVEKVAPKAWTLSAGGTGPTIPTRPTSPRAAPTPRVLFPGASISMAGSPRARAADYDRHQD